MQEMAGEQGAAYIPTPKGGGFTPNFDNNTWFGTFCQGIGKERPQHKPQTLYGYLP